MTGNCTQTGVRPLAGRHLRVLLEVAAGNVSYLPLHGAAVMAPGGHPTRRHIVTTTVAELLFAAYIEIGPGRGRRIPISLTAQGRDAVAVAREAATA